MVTQTGEARLDDGGRVLGHVHQDAARLSDGECAETGRRAGNGQGHVEAEPALAALGRAADDADAGARPERVDEPAALIAELLQESGAHDGQAVGVGLHGFPVGARLSSSIAASSTCSSTKD
jgi:hypothetical protein